VDKNNIIEVIEYLRSVAEKSLLDLTVQSVGFQLSATSEIIDVTLLTDEKVPVRLFVSSSNKSFVTIGDESGDIDEPIFTLSIYEIREVVQLFGNYE